MCTMTSYQVMVRNNQLAPEDGDAGSLDYVGPLIPAGAIFVLSYVVARSFAGVYEQTVTALTVCVLHDVSSYDPPYIGKEMYTSFDISPPWDERPIKKDKDKKKDQHAKPFTRKLVYNGNHKGGRSRVASTDRSGFTRLV